MSASICLTSSSRKSVSIITFESKVMSGFEVAGIALALYPFLVNALEFYRNATGRYRYRLQDYAFELETQQTFYLDTLEQLLTDIVQEDDITVLKNDPRAVDWKKHDYEEKIRNRLDRSYPIYLKTIDRIKFALDTICEKLDMDASSKLRGDESKKTRLEWKRLKFALSKNALNDCLETLRRANGDLREMTHQRMILEPDRRKSQFKHRIVKLKFVKKYAISLYQAFVQNECWNCTCQTCFTASLRLESRIPACTEIDTPEAFLTRFKLLLSQQERNISSTNSTYQEVEFESTFDENSPNTSKTPANPKVKGIRFEENSSSAIKNGYLPKPGIDHQCDSIAHPCTVLNTNHMSETPLGFISGKGYKHYLYRPHTSLKPDIRSKSLDELLSRTNSLQRSERLRIAVTLASSVLQLNGTPWLKSQWSSSDIFFHQRNNDHSNTYPYLPWKECVNTSDSSYLQTSNTAETNTMHCEILLALGQTLVELCFGNTISRMQLPEDLDQDETTTRMKTSKRLLESVYYEMGVSYGDAVRRCLYLLFDVRNMNLENEELQQLVFDNVVVPLGNDLDIFEGRLKIV